MHTMTTEQQIDTELAILYNEWHRLLQLRSWVVDSLHHTASHESRRTRSKIIWTPSDIEAVQDVRELVAKAIVEGAPYLPEPAARHSWTKDSVKDLEKYDKLCGEIANVRDEFEKLEQCYTGWSRFYLVTSSAGHIHSSRCCSTCRPTTTYGWMPQLSGKSESEAVAELGPTLCSVCFPSAPVSWTEGKKLTKAQAESLAV